MIPFRIIIRYRSERTLIPFPENPVSFKGNSDIVPGSDLPDFDPRAPKTRQGKGPVAKAPAKASPVDPPPQQSKAQQARRRRRITKATRLLRRKEGKGALMVDDIKDEEIDKLMDVMMRGAAPDRETGLEASSRSGAAPSSADRGDYQAVQ